MESIDGKRKLVLFLVRKETHKDVKIRKEMGEEGEKMKERA